MKTKALLIAAASAMTLASCDLMFDAADGTPDYDISVGYGGYNPYDNPWYDGFGSGGWNIGYLPAVGPPPVVNPLPSRPHPPGTPPRPSIGPSIINPGITPNRPVINPGGNPGPAIRPGAGGQQPPDIINSGNPGPVMRPSSGQRPGAPGRH